MMSPSIPLSPHFLYCIVLLLALFHFSDSDLFRFIPKPDKNQEPGDFSNDRHFESKRDKTLDCTCGTIPTSPPPSPSNFLFPWQVLIAHTPSENGGTRKTCRGTIINDRIILTTSSCVFKLTAAEVMNDPAQALFFPKKCYAQPNELEVWQTSKLSGASSLEVQHIYHNPQFLFKRALYNKVDYDIALLTLKKALVFDKSTVPVCLPTTRDVDLDGVDSIFTRWHLNNSQDLTTIKEEPSSFMSFIFPIMRCRLNAGHDWISNRFLCTLTPTLAETPGNVENGGALLVKIGKQYTQYGIHSWRTYHPLIFNRKPVSLATDVMGFLGKIESYSLEMGAKWCRNDNVNGVPVKSDTSNGASVNDILPTTSGQDKAWVGTTSDSRRVLKTCKCGLVNSWYKRRANGRIVGGKDATPYEFGWQVYLKFRHGSDEMQHCGGSVINDRIVLTAAHCVYKQVDTQVAGLVRPEQVLVYLNRYMRYGTRDDESRIIHVESVIPHPGFQVTGLVKDDIAILILRKPICFSCLQGKVSPLCFPETGENLNLDGRTDAKVVGWGRTDVNDPKSGAYKLQELGVKIISREKCIEMTRELPNQFYTSQIKDDDKKLCAGNFKSPDSYMDPAQGDSGSPLFLPVTPGSERSIHVGIASMISMGEEAIREKHQKTFTFYARTQAYLDFVDYFSLIVDANWCER